MPEIKCVRCGKKTPRTGPRRIYCPECGRAAELERYRRKSRMRNAEMRMLRAEAEVRRRRAFGDESPKVAALVDELAAKLAAMDEDTRLDTAWQILRRFGLSVEQVSSLVELAEAS